MFKTKVLIINADTEKGLFYQFEIGLLLELKQQDEDC